MEITITIKKSFQWDDQYFEGIYHEEIQEILFEYYEVLVKEIMDAYPKLNKFHVAKFVTSQSTIPSDEWITSRIEEEEYSSIDECYTQVAQSISFTMINFFNDFYHDGELDEKLEELNNSMKTPGKKVGEDPELERLYEQLSKLEQYEIDLKLNNPPQKQSKLYQVQKEMNPIKQRINELEGEEFYEIIEVK